MPEKPKRRMGYLFSLMIVAGLLVNMMVFTPGDTADRFYVCLRNVTDQNLNYATMWCTRSGENCTTWKSWQVASGETMRHWGPVGNGRIYVTIHTGGQGGKYHQYGFNGSTGDCATWSTKEINYNERGFLRIFDLQ